MMTDLATHPISRKWPPRKPDLLQLYACPTPNGIKVAVALEELRIPYETHAVTLAAEDVKSPEFLALNPNGRIPAIIDPQGPGGQTVTLFESGAILIYLAEKSGRLLGRNGAERAAVLQWLMFQMSALGPMLGQLGFFWKFAGAGWEDKRPQQRFVAEGRRLLGVLDRALEGRDWIAGDYSIADIAIAPWIDAAEYYGTRDVLELDNFRNLSAHRDRFYDRPAVDRGRAVPPFGPN